MPPTLSPTVIRMRTALAQRFPKARVHTWSSVSDSNAREGARIALGQPATPLLRVRPRPGHRVARQRLLADRDRQRPVDAPLRLGPPHAVGERPDESPARHRALADDDGREFRSPAPAPGSRDRRVRVRARRRARKASRGEPRRSSSASRQARERRRHRPEVGRDRRQGSRGEPRTRPRCGRVAAAGAGARAGLRVEPSARRVRDLPSLCNGDRRRRTRRRDRYAGARRCDGGRAKSRCW